MVSDMEVIIYGAQSVALGAYKAIKILHPEIKIECFLVTEIGDNAHILGRIPVRELKEFALGKTDEEKKNLEVLIGTPENVMGEIEKSLEDVGIYNYERLDSMRWAGLQERAFVKMGCFTPLSTYPIGRKKANIEVFKMIHHKDKPLKSEHKDPEFVTSVQVGAAFADIRMAECFDNLGDNISNKNGDYSELTGLYWIWRNRIKRQDEKYYGLAQYRRFLELSEDDLLRLADNDIDVVLPYPMPYEPNIEAHHFRYLTEQEWDTVLQALKELEPEYAKALSWFLKQENMYNYNIVLAKGKVLDEYCSWLFPILFRIEEINNPDGGKVPNRYIGYIGETLDTLYFMCNKDKLKIAHAGCQFLC